MNTILKVSLQESNFKLFAIIILHSKIFAMMRPIVATPNNSNKIKIKSWK